MKIALVIAIVFALAELLMLTDSHGKLAAARAEIIATTKGYEESLADLRRKRDYERERAETAELDRKKTVEQYEDAIRRITVAHEKTYVAQQRLINSLLKK